MESNGNLRCSSKLGGVGCLADVRHQEFSLNGHFYCLRLIIDFVNQ